MPFVHHLLSGAEPGEPVMLGFPGRDAGYDAGIQVTRCLVPEFQFSAGFNHFELIGREYCHGDGVAACCEQTHWYRTGVASGEKLL